MIVLPFLLLMLSTSSHCSEYLFQWVILVSFGKRFHWRIQGGARDAHLPGGPNSFIFMQFSVKNWKNNSAFGSWRTPLGKILDQPLDSEQCY